MLAEGAIEGGAVAKLTMQDMLNLFKHDAIHDEGHEDHHVRSKENPGRLLPTSSASGGESGRGTPPIMERDKGKEKDKTGRKEDAVFGRRW